MRTDAEQHVREILANARADRQGILDRGVHVRRTLHILKSLMNQIGRRLHKSDDGRRRSICFRRIDEFVELRPDAARSASAP